MSDIPDELEQNLEIVEMVYKELDPQAAIKRHIDDNYIPIQILQPRAKNLFGISRSNYALGWGWAHVPSNTVDGWYTQFKKSGVRTEAPGQLVESQKSQPRRDEKVFFWIADLAANNNRQLLRELARDPLRAIGR